MEKKVEKNTITRKAFVLTTNGKDGFYQVEVDFKYKTDAEDYELIKEIKEIISMDNLVGDFYHLLEIV